MPLEIDLTKAHKTEHSRNNRRHDHRPGDVQSTVSDGDRDWRAETLNGHVGSGRQSRPGSAVPRSGRGRNRGGRRSQYNKSANRGSSDVEYNDFPSDYTQLSKFSGSLDGPNVAVPYMGTYYFNSNNYLNLDGPTLKEYIKNQM